VVDGHYGSRLDGPATSMQVTFYRDHNGVPAGVKSDQNDLDYTVSDINVFTISLSNVVTFKPGHRYWMSVRANLFGTTEGSWSWYVTSKMRGDAPEWRNPGGGWFDLCTLWTPLAVCITSPEAPGLKFALLK